MRERRKMKWTEERGTTTRRFRLKTGEEQQGRSRRRSN
jgi:hypothetical protein